MTLEELDNKVREERQYAAQPWVKPHQRKEAYRRALTFKERADKLRAQGKTEE